MKEQNSPSSHKSITGSNFSRRQFLTVAGASALALPLLKPWQAFGQATATPDPNSPNPWIMRGCNGITSDIDCNSNPDDPVQGYVNNNIPITGVRHYCATGSIPPKWPTVPVTSPVIPNIGDVSMCVSIYPNHDQLLNGGYDSDLNTFLNDFKTSGGANGGRAMLSTWHETSNYPKCTDDPVHCSTGSNPTRGKLDGTGLQLTGPRIQAMQTYVYNFVKNYFNQNGGTAPAVGAIDIGGFYDRAKAFMAPGLDFYGIDLYQGLEADGVARLNEWDYWVREQGYGAPGATVSVTECNCSDDSLRAAYFSKAANWVAHQTNKGARSFLTFWNGSGGLGGPFFSYSSNCFPGDYAGEAHANTINCLKDIGNQDYGTFGT
jgi:hypothetical protein